VAGVIAVLFGSTDAGTTSYLDPDDNGIPYNPAPINGNTLSATTPEHDGGFIRSAADAYYAAGPTSIP